MKNSSKLLTVLELKQTNKKIGQNMHPEQTHTNYLV